VLPNLSLPRSAANAVGMKVTGGKKIVLSVSAVALKVSIGSEPDQGRLAIKS
jgi:hypothetical protein